MNTWPPPPPPRPPGTPPPHEPGRTPWQPPSRTPDIPGAPSHRPTIGERPDRLNERMLDQRIVTLTGNLDDTAVNNAAGSLALLDASGDDPVRLRLCDVEADLGETFVLLDAVDLMSVPVHASCLGSISGAAVALLAIADHRTAAPHATVRLREPRTEHSGVAREVAEHAAEHRRRTDTLRRRIAAACGRSAESIATDMREQRVLTADEAREYGLIDE